MADADFQDIQDFTGPKRVKTKEVEVEAHNPLTIQRLKERRSAKPTLLSSFAYTQVKPKCSPRVCRDIESNCADDTEC